MNFASDLDSLSVSTLFQALSHNSLKTISEDSLSYYISSRLSADLEYLDLFQFVCFEYLSRECLCDWLSRIPFAIDRRLWELISGVGNEIDFRGRWNFLKAVVILSSLSSDERLVVSP
jgi:hypothetical protein